MASPTTWAIRPSFVRKYVTLDLIKAYDSLGRGMFVCSSRRVCVQATREEEPSWSWKRLFGVPIYHGKYYDVRHYACAGVLRSLPVQGVQHLLDFSFAIISDFVRALGV